jgi:2'-5' RNA ligase
MKENKKYEYGCLMLDFKWNQWQSLLERIDEEDLFEPETGRYGLEKEPHITILYGLHEEVDGKTIQETLKDILYQSIEIQIDGIGIFENEEYDVVKLNVESPAIRYLNKLTTQLPHTTDYPDYKPHMTIAYVKKGLGKKYVSDLKLKFKIEPNFRLSMASGQQIRF